MRPLAAWTACIAAGVAASITAAVGQPEASGLLAASQAAASQAATQPVRIEARSPNLLAVGVVSGERMIIHISRLMDNAPLRDAAVAVLLRGTTYRTVADTDGGYVMTAKDLSLPGAATVEFQVTQGTRRDDLQATLDIGSAPPAASDKSNARQMWWWALNFGVCIGFLWLLARRKKTAPL